MLFFNTLIALSLSASALASSVLVHEKRLSPSPVVGNLRNRSPQELTIDGPLKRDSIAPDSRRAAALNRPVPRVDHPTRTEPMTNAKRLALGLPPLPPSKRGHRRQTQPSSNPIVTKSGVVAVTDANTNAPLGYLSQSGTDDNHFGLTVVQSDAITISFALDSTYSGPIDINAATSYSNSWPLMGAIVGVVSTSDDLNSGSANYVYIQGTTQTDPGSPPDNVSNSYPVQKDSESAVWYYDPSSGALSIQWINTDSSQPATHLMFVSGSDAFVATGDVSKFEATYATSSPVTFSLV